jgi:hypothetical protein
MHETQALIIRSTETRQQSCGKLVAFDIITLSIRRVLTATGQYGPLSR